MRKQGTQRERKATKPGRGGRRWVSGGCGGRWGPRGSGRRIEDAPASANAVRRSGTLRVAPSSAVLGSAAVASAGPARNSWKVSGPVHLLYKCNTLGTFENWCLVGFASLRFAASPPPPPTALCARAPQHPARGLGRRNEKKRREGWEEEEMRERGRERGRGKRSHETQEIPQWLPLRFHAAPVRALSTVCQRPPAAAPPSPPGALSSAARSCFGSLP